MNHSKLAGISVGPGHPVRVMGVINVSPESFYKGSIPANERVLGRKAAQMEVDGADFIDVGAMSTAPYLKTQISEIEEARRLRWAVRVVKKNTSLPISIDSFRHHPTSAGLEAGGKILNDVTGLHGDPHMWRVAKEAEGCILMAHPCVKRPSKGSPATQVKRIFVKILSLCRHHKISLSHVVLDPGIGFFRGTRVPWWRWDLQIIRDLGQLRTAGLPLLVGVSRKSFIGKITGEKNPENRLPGSLAATAIAVMNGASIIRTHDVKETVAVVRMVEKIRRD